MIKIFLDRSINSQILEKRKIKLCRKPTTGKPNYYLPTSYSSIKKSDPTKVSSFIKNEDLVSPNVDLVSPNVKVKKLVK